MDTTTTKTMAKDTRHWRENKPVIWFCKGVQFIAAQWLLIGFAVACVLGRFFPCEFFSFLRLCISISRTRFVAIHMRNTREEVNQNHMAGYDPC